MCVFSECKTHDTSIWCLFIHSYTKIQRRKWLKHNITSCAWCLKHTDVSSMHFKLEIKHYSLIKLTMRKELLHGKWAFKTHVTHQLPYRYKISFFCCSILCGTYLDFSERDVLEFCTCLCWCTIILYSKMFDL